jgi:Spy/CpxP family protein refolding chaperone
MKAELGLSDEQDAQLRKLHQDQRKAQIRRRADLQIARMELQELLAAKTVDEKAIAVKVKEITDQGALGLKSHVDTQLAVRKVLTPEQLEKMKQFHNRPGPQQLRGRRGPRRSEGPEPGDDGLPGEEGEGEAPLPVEGQ